MEDLKPPCTQCSDGSGCIFRWEYCDGMNTCDNAEDENEDICKGMLTSHVQSNLLRRPPL